MVRDAKSALIGLGYRENDVALLIQRVLAESQPKAAEDIIKSALRQLHV